jgi:hypothetical protein
MIICVSHTPVRSTGDLRERVRRLLRSGELPPASSRLWAGKGSGRPCSICGEHIHPSAVEFETDGQVPLVVHQACHAIWLSEDRAVGGET